MPLKFEGVWTYRSFFNKSIEVLGDKLSEGSLLATPWTNPATLEVNTSEDGNVTGKLVFPTFASGVAISLSGKTIEPLDSSPASADISGGVSLTAQLRDTTYQLRGWFIPGSDHLVGTIVCVSKDLAKQPDGTSGPWVAFPAESKS